MQSEIDNKNSKHLTVIDKQEGVIKHTITEIELIILKLSNLLDTSDLCHVSEYISRNLEFK